MKKKTKIEKEQKEKIEEKSEEFFLSGHYACSGCGAAIAMRHIAKIAGKNSIFTIATGCMEVVSTKWPQSSWKLPLIHSAFENAAATASGIEAALKQQGKKMNVSARAGDGGTFDIGLQALSGAIERGHKFVFVCYDNEAYMNTGIQRSSATPFHGETTTTPYGKLIHGKLEWKKNLPFIIASHSKKVYVATASIAYWADFQNKLKKAIAHDGPSYIQVLTPCVPGWGYQSNKSIELARLAVETCIYPLYEIEEGKINLNIISEKPKIVELYLSKQKRFANLTDKEIDEIQYSVNEEYLKLKQLNESKIKIF